MPGKRPQHAPASNGKRVAGVLPDMPPFCKKIEVLVNKIVAEERVPTSRERADFETYARQAMDTEGTNPTWIGICRTRFLQHEIDESTDSEDERTEAQKQSASSRVPPGFTELEPGSGVAKFTGAGSSPTPHAVEVPTSSLTPESDTPS